MPTSIGLMDSRDIARLHEWHARQAEADYDEQTQQHASEAVGPDLYPRPLIDMNNATCDYRAANAFRLPVSGVRKRRSRFYRALAWIGRS